MKFRNSLTASFLFCLALSSGLGLGFSPWAEAVPARFGLSPDNTQELLLSVINSAKKELIVNIYEFSSPVISKALVDQIKKGITLEILIEGQPFGGKVSPGGLDTLRALRTAMDQSSASNRLFVMTNANTASTRRFAFDHAKYVIADGSTLLIASENFTATGHPNSGIVGNRGWETVLESPDLAAKMKAIFTQDTDLTHGDVIEWNAVASLPPVAPDPAATPTKRTVVALPAGKGDVANAEIISSPNSLNDLVSLMRSAKDHLDVEQMSLPSQWRSPHVALSPLVSEMIAAARRGVTVRVLLNDEDAFKTLVQNSPAHVTLPDPGTPSVGAGKMNPNEVTARLLLQAARCEKLPLSARIVSIKNTQITYIHNKGYLVDGNKALVSSINGTQNSVINNREIAILLESKDAAQYFGKAFSFDWDNSPELSADPNPAPCSNQ